MSLIIINESIGNSARKFSYQCQICGSTFQDPTTAGTHVIDCRKDHICSVCGGCFTTPSNLIQHSRIHHVPPSYINHSNASMNANDKRCEADVPLNRCNSYVCPVCDRCFFHYGHLVKHRQTQHRNRPGQYYPCQVCSQVFTTELGLRTHSTIHRGKMQNKCNVCGNFFLTFLAKEQHNCGWVQDTAATIINLPDGNRSTDVHAITNSVPIGRVEPVHRSLAPVDPSHCGAETAPEFKCTSCERSFFSAARLQLHFDSIHGNGVESDDDCAEAASDVTVKVERLDNLEHAPQTEWALAREQCEDVKEMLRSYATEPVCPVPLEIVPSNCYHEVLPQSQTALPLQSFYSKWQQQSSLSSAAEVVVIDSSDEDND